MPMQERGVPRLFTDELVSVDASGPSPVAFAVGSPDWPSTTAAIIRDRFQTTMITVFDAKQLRTCIDEATSKDNFHSLHTASVKLSKLLFCFRLKPRPLLLSSESLK